MTKIDVEVENELDNAHQNLTPLQMEDIAAAKARGESVSHIACSLSLPRSYVHSYFRLLNQPSVAAPLGIPAEG